MVVGQQFRYFTEISLFHRKRTNTCQTVPDSTPLSTSLDWVANVTGLPDQHSNPQPTRSTDHVDQRKSVASDQSVASDLDDGYAVFSVNRLPNDSLQHSKHPSSNDHPQTTLVQMTQDGTAIKTIIGLGEILWDIFPDSAKFGGAPANFACSVAGLKTIPAEAYMLSAVGKDSLGQQAIQALSDHDVRTDAIQQHAKATGQVNVTLDEHGSASYEFAADAAWDNLSWSDSLADLAAKADAVCWGTLGQRCQPSQDVIQKFVAATPPDCLRVLDINLRSPFWNQSVLKESLPMANVLKCNEDELPVLSQVFEIDGDDRSVLLQLKQRFGLKLVALTRGGRDSMLLQEDEQTRDLEISQLPAIPAEVVDTVGAGDCFTAAIVLGMLGKMRLTDLHQWACQVSAYVCSQSGATPTFPADLSQP